ncbi:MAG: hypothetical protein NWR51_14120 [Akkermansiaceae bacterium]|jgi:hypothetical protein|nr:hypothetical protein [Akkermansiaceae bacterium]
MLGKLYQIGLLLAASAVVAQAGDRVESAAPNVLLIYLDDHGSRPAVEA